MNTFDETEYTKRLLNGTLPVILTRERSFLTRIISLPPLGIIASFFNKTSSQTKSVSKQKYENELKHIWSESQTTKKEEVPGDEV